MRKRHGDEADELLFLCCGPPCVHASVRPWVCLCVFSDDRAENIPDL